MSLIRGVNGLCPCPRCLIQADQQGDPSACAPARTAANTQTTIRDARRQKFAKDKEEKLKLAGLRDVDVCHFPIFFLPLFTVTPTERLLEDRALRPTRGTIF